MLLPGNEFINPPEIAELIPVAEVDFRGWRPVLDVDSRFDAKPRRVRLVWGNMLHTFRYAKVVDSADAGQRRLHFYDNLEATNSGTPRLSLAPDLVGSRAQVYEPMNIVCLSIHVGQFANKVDQVLRPLAAKGKKHLSGPGTLETLGCPYSALQPSVSPIL